MSYTALYRKFRPQEFEDVRGQEHIVTTLKNQIRAERVGHAYLFCGTRGTGKTTIAKIFARAVNCDHPREGSPCGQCPSCRAIGAGSSMNVIEIDAASNNGVDNIREIREEVAYSPTEGRYKVYIIDEVHMLSTGAFNALLKTLEEPPSYVIFILATTEAHKIPVTILSRCQRYDFRRITIDAIAARLEELMEKEQVEVEPKAIRYIAKAADGSMRDALSLLDQCIAFYLGERLTFEKVLEVLGAVDTEVFSDMLQKILRQDVAGVIILLEELVAQGREPGQFVTDFTWYLRNLLLLQSSDNMEDVLDISSENLQLLKEESAMAEPEQLIRYIRIFSELSGQLRYGTQKRILLEIALIKLCRPQMERDYESLVQRISSLEKQMEQGIPVSRGKISQGSSGKNQGEPAAVRSEETAENEPAPRMPKAVPEDIQKVVQNWRSIIEGLSGGLKNYLKTAHLSLSGENQLLIVLEDEVAEAFVGTETHMQELKQVISERTGKEVEVKIQLHETGRPAEDTYVDLGKLINMEIVIED
ncbi:DNA polymerase III, subunit gamma and tau [Eubacterium sp. 14-2]|uniref:DNA polymerase III subunit gamma/tau n=1 Tax=Eubacterium sp. 14-2 TaxID=1235790 RepID=UPI00033E26C1|nr:DNA polymerase III subunit gamma/tau [Eubacterium sp. 14-2]EOT22461.1 DNA polymerase III, subunit gamma and tau [Eubacterium sp. 14-2]